MLVKKIIFVLLGVNIIVASLFNSFNVVNSDTIWPYLLLPHLFKDLVYLGPDTFILHYPVSWLLVKLVGINTTTVFLDTFLLLVTTLSGWLVFYFYFLKRYLPKLKLIYILPAFLLINFSKVFYQIIGIPSLRNIEFAIALLVLIYFDNYLALSGKKLLKLGVFLVMLLLFISDPYFIYVFALPLVLVLFLKSLGDGKYWGITGLMSLAIVADTVTRNLLNKTQYFFFSGVSNAHIVYFSKIGSNIELTFNGILNILDSYPNLQILSLFSIGLFFLGVYGLRRMFREGLKDKKRVTLLMLPLIFVFTILAYVASGQPTDIETCRYLIFIVFALPFGIVYAISKFSSKYVRRSVALGLIFLSLTNIIQMGLRFNGRNMTNPYEKNQTIIKAAQDLGLSYGYTGYWSAGINTFLSGNKLQFIQVACADHMVLPQKWLASDSWFEEGNYSGKTFLMMSGLGGCSLEDVTKQFGKPFKVVSIPSEDETYSLMIFDYNIAEKF